MSSGHSRHSRSLRGCLPLGALALEAALILTFFFFTSYENLTANFQILRPYQVFQDVTVMAALGLGFLTTSLKRFGWSCVTFNLFLLVLGVQWAILLDGFLHQPFGEKIVLNPTSIQQATMTTMSVLISVGTVLGKVNLVQLMVMALLEVAAFSATRMVNIKVLHMESHISMMYVHVFAAYFGLGVTLCLPLKPLHPEENPKQQTTTRASLFSMLGTLFLWIFWPSFNSALLNSSNEKKNAVFNTYYALAVSAVTAISLSAFAHPQGKISMIHIHNAVLAGGVAIGAPGHLIQYPSYAMMVGLLAGLISTGGANCLPVCFNRVLRIHDTSGVHYTFGLPGLLGGIVYILLIMLRVLWINNVMINYQMLIEIGALSLSLAAGLVCGLLTGVLLKLNIWKAPHMLKYFDDQTFWKFPHLAAGF
ncbi:blood group Rh(CE) polypeptide [Rhynchocyon petersi]